LITLFSSCSNTVSNEVDEEYPIEVEAIIDPQFTLSSRGVRLSSTNLSSFGVWGFYNGVARIRNVVYTKNNGVWRGNRAMTWAAGGMNFYGFSPSFSVSSGNLNVTMLEDPKNVEYESPADVDSQVDVMYSSLYNLKRTDNNGKVKFSFKPAMHYIGFTGNNAIGTEYKVFVKEIILHNIVSNGKFVYNATRANVGSWTLATGSDAKYVNMRKEFTTPVELTSSTIQMLNGEYFIIIPQACTMWRTSKDSPIPIATADANHNYYIETVAQIIKVENGVDTYLLGNPDNSDPIHPQYESVYFPASARTFRINAGSTIPINFNGGYNADGLPYLENNDRGGDVDIEVSEWMDFDFEIEEWIPIYEDLIF
jgi:hypothetical protein